MIILRLVNQSKYNIKFVKTIPYKINRKSKKVIIVSSLVSTLCFTNFQPVMTMDLSVPPTPVLKVHLNYEYIYELKVAPTIVPKSDKITFLKYEELPFYIYMMDHRFLETSETKKLINKILVVVIEASAAFVFLVFMWKIFGFIVHSFVRNNLNKVADRPNPF